ncbi:MAG: 23S rRNA (uridine(2552)-2'-O)-methyltransferase RlmE [Endozoicomonadaceae bacterium]|nr:23S rRNA (uridine(2552)-2'-O)-methyltransferase RlmE [Endozoicomonadaceae bacterium]MBE8233175.1 23S rRNA (uridine(2552)-2'-O)-methyltransferase RlmE [Endozoicomonadaceae bacterium]
MPRSKRSNQRWLNEWRKDPYVQQAWRSDYRSRASFKLLELNKKDQLLKPGHCVVDLGSTPGGWSQVASECVGKHGCIIASDILPMEAIAGVKFVQGDFTEELIYQSLLDSFHHKQVDLVMSDMAPNLSGIRVVDQMQSMYLVELALDFAVTVLKPGGNFLTKIFQGEGFDVYCQLLKKYFAKIFVRKPDASKDRSREVYLIGQCYRG